MRRFLTLASMCLVSACSSTTNIRVSDPGAIVGGLLFYVPILWVTEYKYDHAYEFDCWQAPDVTTD